MLSGLTEDVAKYQNQEMEMRLTISQADSFQVRYDDADKNLNALKKQFFLPMDPESLDETITALIVQAGFAPRDLQMTSLQQGYIPEYTIQPLDPAGMPIVTTPEATDENQDATGEEPGTTEEDQGGETGGEDGTAVAEGPEGPTAESGIEAFVYTIAANANGDKNNLSRLIDIVNQTSGIELNSYRYSLAEDTVGAGVLTEPGNNILGGTVDLEFYVFVYIDITSGIGYAPMETAQ